MRRTLYASTSDASYEVGHEVARKPDEVCGMGSSWEAAFEDAAELKKYLEKARD